MNNIFVRVIFFLQLLLKIPFFVKNWWQVYIHIIRKINNQNYQVMLRGGERFWLRAGLEDVLVLEEVYHQKEYLQFTKFIPQVGATVIDIGGYIGDYSLQASKLVGESGKVIVFEPVASLVKLIEANKSLNNAKNIQIFHGAVGAKKEQTPIYFNPKLPGASSSQNLQAGLQSEIVNQFGINEIIAKQDGTIFVKIDAEGAEFEIINAISTNNLKKITTLTIEYHLSVKNPSEKIIIDRLVKNGFNFQQISHPYFAHIGMLYFFRK